MISWLSKKLSQYFVNKSEYKTLEERIMFLERALMNSESVAARQSELLAAMAGVQNDLVMAVGDNLLHSFEKSLVSESESAYVQKFILSPPDDDDLIN